MKFKDLIGKTITGVTKKKVVDCDDNGFLELKFSDGSTALIVASYGEWTGESEEEYPTRILICNKYEAELEDCENE